MFSRTLVRQVVVPAAVFAGIFITTTTASAEPVGDASLVAESDVSTQAPLEPVAPTESALPVAPDAPVAPAAPVSPEVSATAIPDAAAAPVVRTGRARMLDFTMKSAETLDMRGVEPSLYKGRYYRAAVEKKRQCVAKRESEGFYDVVSHSGYYGAYQMSPSLAKGATWMMLKEHKKLLGEDVAKRVLSKLRATPINKWPRYWQDAAFSTVYNWEYTGSGAGHWRGGRWHC